MSGIASESAFTRCLETNKRWAKETAEKDPELLPRLAAGQSPQILWLGCSDSRIPETTLMGVRPGEVFTHRNIANIMNPTDTNMLSVVEYAVRHLKVKHVVICGHASCGGVAATLGNAKLGVIDIWLQPMREIREKYADELQKLPSKEAGDFLSKRNVEAGCCALKRVPTVIEAMKERGLEIHGVFYHPGSGLLEVIDCFEDDKTTKDREWAFETK